MNKMRLVENLSILDLEEFLSVKKDWDIFINCSSFEERCTRSSDIFIEKEVKIGTSIIFNYKETDPENKKEENIKKIKKNLEKISQNAHILDVGSVSHPSKGIKKFLHDIKEKNIDLSDKDIIVDITVFTKPYFFLLFKVMKEKFNIHRFYVTYTEPEKYKSKNIDSNKIVLTEGLDRIEPIPGFNGSSVNSKDALIVILGFEGKRSLDVFYSLDPELTYAVNGVPSFQPGWHKVSLEANLRFLQESGAFKYLFFAPAVDPFETKKVVFRIVKEIKRNYEDLNIVVSPLGTKLQAFGVLLYTLQDNKITVIYPFPSIYKADYSYKYGPSHIFKVDLDTLNEGEI